MSNGSNGPDGLPSNELNIIGASDGTAYFFGLDIVLTQDDVPYTPPAAGQRRLPSNSDFLVFGDTVTIGSQLINAGRDIRIVARQVIFQPGAVLDTAGPDPDPDTDFTPGVPAEQQDESAGAAGQDGSDGGPASSGGDIVVVAESLIGQAGTTGGTVQINQIPIAQTMEELADAAIAAFASSGVDPLPISAVSDPIPGNLLQGTIDFATLQVSGLSALATTRTTFDPTTGLSRVSISAPNLTLTGTVTVTLTNVGQFQGTLESSPFGVDLEYQFAVDPENRTLTPTSRPDPTIAQPVITITLPSNLDLLVKPLVGHAAFR
jgi:hypothetical protein